MGDDLEQFVDTLHEVDGDDQIMKAFNVKGLLKQGENMIKEMFEGESKKPVVEEKSNTDGSAKRPLVPSGPTPTYQESAFLSIANETGLYNVTNKEDKLPTVTTKSNIFKNVKYRFKGLNVTANYEKGNEEFTVFAGRRNGVGWTKTEGSVTTKVNAYYKASIHNGKTNLEYSVDTPSSYHKVTLYNNKDASGASVNYSNKRGLNSAFSVDTESAAASIGYEGNYRGANIEAEAYVTTGERYSSPFLGVDMRITF